MKDVFISSTIKRKKDLDNKIVFFKNYARFNSLIQSVIYCFRNRNKYLVYNKKAS